ncbi:MAG: hypothetical protein V3T31_08050 [candidate division Zixibacteria bacterium]
MKKTPLIKHTDLGDFRKHKRNFTGEFEGVLFLGNKNLHGKYQVLSLELEAIRYIRPISAEWRTNHPGMICLGKPMSIDGWFPADAKELSVKTGRPLRFYIADDSKGMPNAHDYKWKYTKISDGIWGINLDEVD